MNPQALPVVSIPWEIHEEAKALGMDAEELWRQRQELAEWVQLVADDTIGPGDCIRTPYGMEKLISDDENRETLKRDPGPGWAVKRKRTGS